MKHRAWIAVFLLAAGCAASLSSSTKGDGVADPEDADIDEERASINGRRAPELSLTTCELDGPTAELCRAERDCLGGDAAACLAAAAHWEGEGADGVHWIMVFNRRACAGGLADGCEACAVSMEGMEGDRAFAVAQRYWGKCCDLGKRECCDRCGSEGRVATSGEPAPEPPVEVDEPPIDAPPPVPALKVTRSREFEIQLAGDRFVGRGLPAISADGGRMAHLLVNGDPAGKAYSASLVVIDAARDRVEVEKILLERGEKAASAGSRDEVLERIEEANRQLDLTEWERMEAATQEADVLEDCSHLEDTEAGEVCVQNLVVGGLTVRYAEPLLAVGETETKRSSWTVDECKGQAYIATAAASDDGGALMLEIRYRRAEGCDDRPPAIHAVKID